MKTQEEDKYMKFSRSLEKKRRQNMRAMILWLLFLCFFSLGNIWFSTYMLHKTFESFFQQPTKDLLMIFGVFLFIMGLGGAMAMIPIGMNIRIPSWESFVQEEEEKGKEKKDLELRVNLLKPLLEDSEDSKDYLWNNRQEIFQEIRNHCTSDIGKIVACLEEKIRKVNEEIDDNRVKMSVYHGTHDKTVWQYFRSWRWLRKHQLSVLIAGYNDAEEIKK